VLTLQTGGLPPPEALKITAQDNNPMIYLNWTQGRSDPRIIGWRVYRSDGGAFKPVGSTWLPGFVDVSATLDKGYLYRVTSFDAQGNESALSASAAMAAPSYVPNRVFLPAVRR
ncbi:MAG: hypothetical protein K1X39_13625, partial [Thermoflexales bacterium]|nr:hypothetical protein [Thermoflexales bacterium]